MRGRPLAKPHDRTGRRPTRPSGPCTVRSTSEIHSGPRRPPMPDAPITSDPAKRHSAALTDGPDRAARQIDAQGRRVHGRGSRQAADRRRHDLDRDDALQPQPAPPRRVRQGRHPGSRRHPDGVQHDRGQRRRDDGDRRDEVVARQPRGHRRLDRARRARPSARRRGLPRRLRQDDPRRRRWRSDASTSPVSRSTTGRSIRASSTASATRPS